eukprot:7407673-Pyramimonas_sp.AAC.1
MPSDARMSCFSMLRVLECRQICLCDRLLRLLCIAARVARSCPRSVLQSSLILLDFIIGSVMLPPDIYIV